MSASTRLWLAVSAGSTAAVAAVVFGGVAAPLRAPVVAAFLLLCPGTAFVRLLRIGDPVATLTLALALSVALDGIVAGTMLYAGAWSPEQGLVILMALTVLGTALETMRAFGRASPRAGGR